MPADLIHLVRHGEVFNPDGILYGRLPGYHLSELGEQMAAVAAQYLVGRPVVALYASPLQRAQESAAPWSTTFGLDIQTDDRLIEPTNRFEGQKFEFGPQVLIRPRSWPWVINPWRPSWGEPFASVASRMMSVIDDAYHSVDGGEVVMVSHQMPIVMVQRHVTGQRLPHDPRNRRCNLSSITTLARRTNATSGPAFAEVDYQEPAAALLAGAIDTGAV